MGRAATKVVKINLLVSQELPSNPPSAPLELSLPTSRAQIKVPLPSELPSHRWVWGLRVRACMNVRAHHQQQQQSPAQQKASVPCASRAAAPTTPPARAWERGSGPHCSELSPAPLSAAAAQRARAGRRGPWRACSRRRPRARETRSLPRIPREAESAARR